MTKTKAKKPHYVNNKEFLQAMIEWNDRCKIAKDEGKSQPPITNYILQYVHNFNPEKSDNPFAYFTQIIYYAFLRRIQKEKKQAHVKNKIIENMNVDMFLTQEENGELTNNPYTDYLQKNYLPDEDVYKPKKKKDKPKGLELFYNEDSTDN